MISRAKSRSQAPSAKAGACADSPCAPERIRDRAYAIYQYRSGNDIPGDPLIDWLQAERELHELSRGELLMKGNQEC